MADLIRRDKITSGEPVRSFTRKEDRLATRLEDARTASMPDLRQRRLLLHHNAAMQSGEKLAEIRLTNRRKRNSLAEYDATRQAFKDNTSKDDTGKTIVDRNAAGDQLAEEGYSEASSAVYKSQKDDVVANAAVLLDTHKKESLELATNEKGDVNRGVFAEELSKRNPEEGLKVRKGFIDEDTASLNLDMGQMTHDNNTINKAVQYLRMGGANAKIGLQMLGTGPMQFVRSAVPVPPEIEGGDWTWMINDMPRSGTFFTDFQATAADDVKLRRDLIMAETNAYLKDKREGGLPTDKSHTSDERGQSADMSHKVFRQITGEDGPMLFNSEDSQTAYHTEMLSIAKMDAMSTPGKTLSHALSEVHRAAMKIGLVYRDSDFWSLGNYGKEWNFDGLGDQDENRIQVLVNSGKFTPAEAMLKLDEEGDLQATSDLDMSGTKIPIVPGA